MSYEIHFCKTDLGCLEEVHWEISFTAFHFDTKLPKQKSRDRCYPWIMILITWSIRANTVRTQTAIGVGSV